MKRLTVYLINVSKEKVNGKDILRNTLSFEIKKDSEADKIISDLKSKKNEIKKYQISNIL